MPEKEISSTEILLMAKVLYILKQAVKKDRLDEREATRFLDDVRIDWDGFKRIVDAEFPQNGQRGYPIQNVEKKLIISMQKWLSGDKPLSQTMENNSDLVCFAEALGLICAYNRASKQQMRILLDGLKEPKYSKPDTVLLLKPHLAYATARGRALQPFADVMFICLDKVRKDDSGSADLEALQTFTQAVFAFFYGYAK